MSLDSGLMIDAEPRLSGVRRWRGPVILLLVLVVFSTLLALAQGSRVRGYLDPAAADPSGSLAIARLLEDQGVRVVRVTSASDAAEAIYSAGTPVTLLVAPTAPLSPDMVEAAMLTATSHRVLVAPGPDALSLIAPWATLTDDVLDDSEVAPGCAWDVAVRAGAVPAAGPRYSAARNDSVSCYAGAVLDLPGVAGERPTTVVGLPSLLTNATLADSGNASLALGLLGRDATLVWWLPSYNDPLQFPPGEDVAVLDLVPTWVPWALVQGALALLVVVWWRGRRLGRVVVEPLPVVVRATEAVEGRARLYRRAGARDRAADVLRDASGRRLRARLALPRGADLAELLAAVAARTGRDEADVAALLSPGSTPLDDAGLTRLADALDTLEDEVRRT